MNAADLTLFTTEFLTEALYGLGFLAFILLLDTFLFVQILIWFKRYCERSHGAPQFKYLWRFMACVLLLCIVQLLSILLWTWGIYAKGLMDNLTTTLLFVGSCYTTLGVYSDLLPKGWRFMALYIAISGLFTFAMATSAMISMVGSFAKAQQPVNKESP
ncbi:MAG: hypothetical protein ACMV0J_06105 [Fluviibacter sp.]